MSQGESRTAGAADEGMRTRQICSWWLPETVRDLVGCVTLAIGLPSRSRIVLGAGRALKGIRACFARLSSMNLSSAPESTSRYRGREL